MDVTLAVSYQSGTVLRGVGFIDLESWDSEAHKATVSLHPRDNNWEVFAGDRPDDSGSLKSVTINGVTYRATGDANASVIPAKYKNEPAPHSGGNLRKMSLQARTISGITLTCSAQEIEALRAIAEG